jgi:hypothetical protein
MAQGSIGISGEERTHRRSAVHSAMMRTIFLLLTAALLAVPQSPTRADDSWMLYDDSQVARIDITVAPEALEHLWANVLSDSLHLASIRFRNAWIDEEVAAVGFGLRGNTSRHSAKKSFKLSFNEFVPGREFYDVDKLNLNGEHNDPTICRAKLCWDLFGRAGIPASRAAHAEVWINGAYHGLRISVEHIDDEFLWKRFDDDSGNLWKCLWPADLAWRGPDPESYRHEVNDRRVYELKTNEEADDYSALLRLVRNLHQTGGGAIEDSLESLLDVAGVLQYFAFNVLVGGWDDYWYLSNNYYLYHEPSTDILTLIPYDYDNTFGIDWFGVDWSERAPYNWGSGGRPLAERLLERPRWRGLYGHFLAHYAANLADRAHWEERLDSLRLAIAPFALDDSFRTLDYGFGMDDFHAGFGLAPYENQHVRRGIREFAQRRISSIGGQLEEDNSGPSIYRVARLPRSLQPAESLRVEAAIHAPLGLQAALLRWRSVDNGPWQSAALVAAGDPLAPRVEDADAWVAWLPPPGAVDWLEIELLASDGQGRMHRWPATGPQRLPVLRSGNLRLNELLARNNSQGQDPAGEFDDWVELVNLGAEAVPLAGHYLSDRANNLQRWRFPDHAGELAPGEYLIVWCDGDVEQEGLHASFALNGDGEFLALTAPDGATVIDSLSFGPQLVDISWGRLPDGHGTWHFLAPTPGRSNDGTSVAPRPQRPDDLELRLAPNPFNGRCRIGLRSPSAAQARVTVYDLLGRRVWSTGLHLEAGRQHSLVWEGRDDAGREVASGRYLLEVDAGGRRQSASLLLLR